MTFVRLLFGFAAAVLGVLAFGSVARIVWGPTDADATAP